MQVIAYAVRRPWTLLGWVCVLTSTALGAVNLLLPVAWHLGEAILYERVSQAANADESNSILVRMVETPGMMLIAMSLLGACMGAKALAEQRDSLWAKAGLFTNLATALAALSMCA